MSHENRNHHRVSARLATATQTVGWCLVELAILLARRGHIVASETTLHRGLAAYETCDTGNHPIRLRGEARYWTVRGLPTRALPLLERYVDAGYPVDRLRDEADFSALHSHTRFATLIGDPLPADRSGIGRRVTVTRGKARADES